MTRKQTFSLVEISKWAIDRQVNLPNVQRGFVWKPNQIENLWDSILRGYPVGAFVLTENGNGSFDLLDGQQRATTICLGFGSGTLQGVHDRVKVFIDVADPDDSDTRRYIIRAITKFHPWGYQRKDNTKPLDAESIRRAMNLYDIFDHLEPPLDSFFPYDAELPIPLKFFIESKNIEKLLATLQEWGHWKTIENRWLDKNKANSDQDEALSQPLDRYKSKISAILQKVKLILNEKTGQKIPALYLDRQLLTEDLHPESPNIGNTLDDEDDSEDVENLFIRLNSGGTPLRGEELNYSILKANIDKSLQDQIEDACGGLIDPARFITIAFRLFQHQKQSTSRDTILMRIKPKQFQRHIGESRKEFEIFLKDIINKKEFDKKTLLEHAKYLLLHREDLPYGLPYPVVSRLSDRAPEVVFMLLYRLLIKKDSLATGKEELHRKMIGMVSIFLWFGKGERQRDRSRLLANIWPCVRSLETQNFWSSSTIRRAMLDNVLPPIPHKDELSVLAKPKTLRANTGLLSQFTKNNACGDMASKAFFNRDLILYAQRSFLAETFKEQYFDQDDTNTPFDWDHISPTKLIAKKRSIPKAIREWYNTNGNLRAWPYSLNRIDQDGTPQKKLDPLNPEHFVESENETTKRIEASWCEYFKKTGKKFDKNHLAAQLLEWSFCAKDWAKCTATDLKNSLEWKNVYNLIIERNLEIYHEWHNELHIGKLRPTESNISICKTIKKSKWNFNPKDLNEFFDYGNYDFWASKTPIIEGRTTHLYLAYPSEHNEEELGILSEDAIQLGLFEKSPCGFIDGTRVPEDLSSRYTKYEKTHIYGTFTLVSDDDESYLSLWNDFRQWLQAFPSSEKNSLTDSFCDFFEIQDSLLGRSR